MRRTRGFRWAFIAVVFAGVGPLPSVAHERIEPGYYETTTLTDDHKTPVISHDCVSAERVKEANGDEPSFRRGLMRGDAGCTVENLTLVDRTASYTMACTGLTVTIVATYYGDSSEMVTKSLSRYGDRQTQYIKSRRVGKCP